jgi:cellulose synthase operon protein C
MCPSRLFQLRQLPGVGLLASLCLLAVACQGDPAVRKQKYLESGNGYFAEGKFDHAIIEYRNAVDLDATFGEARKRLAESYAKVGDVQHALEEYVRAADLLPQDVDVQLTAGAFLLAARKPEEAVARADAALREQPDNIQAHLLRGNALAGLSSFDDALTAIEEAIRLDPGRGTTFTHLGLVEFARGRRKEAETAFSKAVELAPNSIEAHLARGNFYWSIGRPAETEQAFLGALKVQPNNGPANRAMAAFTVASGRYKEAEQYLLRLADSSPDPSAVFALTDYYLASGRAKDAAARLEAFSQKYKDVPGIGQRLARAYAAAGDSTRAKTLVEQVLAGNPGAVDAQLLKGQLLLNEGQRDQAFETVRATASANPASPEAQFALGRLYAARGDNRAAETAFREVLRINPRAGAAQLEIARLQLSSGDRQASLRTAEDAAKSQPRNAAARLTLVRSLLASKDLARAERELASLKSDFPNVSPVHVQAGMLALLKNDVAGARTSLDRAQTLQPASIDVLAGLIALDLRTSKPDAARARIDERLKSGATPELYLLAARTYWTLKDQGATERTLRLAIDADPSLLPPYEMLGQLYLAQRKLDQARTEFEALAKRQAKPVGPLTMSGIILQSQGQSAEAKKRFQDVLAIDSNAVIAANNLAWILADSGEDLDMALKLAQTATAQSPDAPELIDTLGWVYYKKDLPDLAIPFFERAAAKAPGNAGFHHHLGLAYLKVGKSDRGRASLERALATGIDSATAETIRRTLSQLEKR